LLLPILLPRPILLTIPVPIPSSHIIIGWNKKSFLDKNNRFMLTCFGDGGKMVFVGYCMIEVEKGGFMIKKGKLILLTSGEYSDYSVLRVCRCLKDINTKELEKEYLKIYPDQAEAYGLDYYKYLAFLINEKKALEEIKVTEYHIGNYGGFAEGYIE
jgi:hypothetical protein